MEVLNKPNPNDSCEIRDAAAVSPQAFTLLNSDLMSDRSIALAERLQRETPRRSQQIRRAIELAFGREASEDELDRLATYVREMNAYHHDVEPEPKTYPTEITRSLVEEFSGKPFEYTEWLPAFENYQPDTKPWDVKEETRSLADLCLMLLNANEFVYVY
jgi:hypothetical protein